MSERNKQRLRLILPLIVLGATGTLATKAHYDTQANAEHLAIIRAILENENIALIITNDRGEIIEWTSGAEAIFGYTRAEVLGRTPLFLMSAEDGRKHAKAYAISLENVNFSETRIIKCTAYRKDGNAVDVRVTLHFYKVNDQIFIRASCVKSKNVKYIDARDDNALNSLSRPRPLTTPAHVH